MDEVAAKRQSVIITKRGKAVAELIPIEKEKDDIFGFYKGKIEITGTLFPLRSAPKSGAIFIDPPRHPRRGLARARLSADIYKGTVSD
jgi:antitoxin (DNA-binding transcriptional repressor) of toxin-antitoxin stability system